VQSQSDGSVTLDAHTLLKLKALTGDLPQFTTRAKKDQDHQDEIKPVHNPKHFTEFGGEPNANNVDKSMNTVYQVNSDTGSEVIKVRSNVATTLAVNLNSHGRLGSKLPEVAFKSADGNECRLRHGLSSVGRASSLPTEEDQQRGVGAYTPSVECIASLVCPAVIWNQLGADNPLNYAVGDLCEVWTEVEGEGDAVLSAYYLITGIHVSIG
jgi:hypothetical protein